jgi:hypothetical protein
MQMGIGLEPLLVVVFVVEGLLLSDAKALKRREVLSPEVANGSAS